MSAADTFLTKSNVDPGQLFCHGRKYKLSVIKEPIYFLVRAVTILAKLKCLCLLKHQLV